MIDAGRIRNKGLKLFWVKGDPRKLRPDWVPRVKWLFSLLRVALDPGDLNIPGAGWHMLEGNRKGTYSVKVSRNWRLTYKWDGEGPYDIDLEDYHGK